ncbi:MAG: hypothetical protein KKH51_08970 [Actinobacteria bacterium]|nr:hypothetical protein [Actinomycetota bacterium]
MTDPAFAGVLADLLRRAEAAHLAYQEEHGPTDWPQFYAKHLVAALGEENYREEDVLTALLAAASAHGIHEAQEGKGRDEKWPEWYAEHMADRLSRQWYLDQALDDGEF